MRYINIREGSGPVETIDEFEDVKEARRCLKEYRMSYQGTGYDCWLSSRSTKDWRQR